MIELNWTIFLQFANFLLLLIVLNFVLYRPFRRLIEERRSTVEGSQRRARELESQIAEKMGRYQERLQEAKIRGNQEKMKVRQQALEEEGKTLAGARERAAEHVQKIKGRVVAEQEAARQALQRETETLAGQIAAKVLGRSL